jgi:hypothetical protein
MYQPLTHLVVVIALLQDLVPQQATVDSKGEPAEVVMAPTAKEGEVPAAIPGLVAQAALAAPPVPQVPAAAVVAVAVAPFRKQVPAAAELEF